MKYLWGKKIFTIFRLHEVLQGKNYPLYSDYMKYWGGENLTTIFRLHEVLRKKNIIHYIPIT